MSTDTALAGLRKRWALNQTEVAALLGVSPDTVSRYENGERCPSLLAAIGLELLYGKPLTALFPEHLFSVASSLLSAVAQMSIDVEGSDDQADQKKRAFIAEVSARIDQLVPGI